MSYPRLKDKIVLINDVTLRTGASAGFGEATARAFAASGSKLVLGARRTERLEALKQELESKYQVRVHVGYLDVASFESAQNFMSSIPADLSAIDILVNNAGLALGFTTTWDYDLKDAYTMLDTNVKGCFHMIKLVVPGMIARNRGHVINVSSIAGLEAYRNGSMYCATKHALEAMNASLRKELVHTPIRVTSIQPGLAETEFSIVRFHGDVERAKSVYKGIAPLLAEDIADNIVEISELTVLATNQASTEIIHKETK